MTYCKIFLLSFFFLVSATSQGADPIVERNTVESALKQYEDLSNESQILLLEGTLKKCDEAFGKIDTTRAKVLGALSKWHFDNRAFDIALGFSKEQLAVLISLPSDKESIAKVTTQTAENHKWCYQFTQAEELYKESISLRELDALENFDNYIGLATICYSQGNYDLLIEYAKFALSLARQPQQSCEALNYMFQGYARMGQPDECQKLVEEALDIAKSHGLTYYLGKAYSNLAWTELIRKEYNEAIKYYDKAVSLIMKSDNSKKHRTISFCYSTMSGVYSKLEKPELALQYAKKALSENQSFFGRDYHPDIGARFHNVASKYAQQKDFGSALRYIQSSIKCYIRDESLTDSRKQITKDALYKTSIKKDLLLALKVKSLYYAYLYLDHGDINDVISAEKTLSDAVDLIDIMRAELSTDNTKLWWRDKTRSIYDIGVELCDWMDDKECMHRYMEKARSILLIDELNHKDALAFIPEHLAERENLLRNNFLASKEQDVMQFQVYNEFLDSLKAVFPAYYKYKFDVQIPSIEEVQSEILNDSTQVLEYYSTYDSLYLLNVTTDSTELISSARPKKLAQEVHQLLSYVSHKDSLDYLPSYETFVTLSHDLYKSLLLDRLKLKKPYTIVIGDGPINFIPFDLLSRSEDMGSPDYLIKYHRFSYAPSLAILMKCTESRTFDNLLMVSPSEFSALGLSDLSQSRKEANAISKLVDSHILAGEDASLSSFVQSCSNYDVIHFSSHSGVDSLSSSPWIAFQDSLIDLGEIFKLDLNAALVTLSSCKSLGGESNTSEGVNSLARAFLFADAASVIGSVWDLNEAAGFEVLHDFYKGLRAGENKPEALRAAKLKYIKAHQYKSPYYWAPLVLIGDPSGLDVTQTQSMSHIIILGLMILVFMIFLLKKIWP